MGISLGVEVEPAMVQVVMCLMREYKNTNLSTDSSQEIVAHKLFINSKSYRIETFRRMGTSLMLEAKDILDLGVCDCDVFFLFPKHCWTTKIDILPIEDRSERCNFSPE